MISFLPPFAFILLLYGAIIFGLAVLLRKLCLAQRIEVFTSFTLFGIISGLAAALNGLRESTYIFNIPGVLLGDQAYGWSIDRFGDPHSGFAHYTIPWVLRVPQVYVLTSAATWGLLGFLAQLTYNLVKKPKPVRTISIMYAMILLVACLSISVGATYIIQGEAERQGPVHPQSYPVIQAGTPPAPDWNVITTWQTESLSLSSTSVKVGHELDVTAIVRNNGSQEGIAEVEIEVNGKVLNSQKKALLPGESKPVRFVILVPRPGTYAVRIGSVTESFQVLGN